MSLPAANVSRSALKETRYGLDTVAPHLCGPGSQIFQQLAEMEEWTRAPLRLDRPEEYKPLLQQAAWDLVTTHIKQYLGFLHSHHPLAGRLSLVDYREHFGDGYMRFMSFLRARGCHGATFIQHCTTAGRVLHWLR